MQYQSLSSSEITRRSGSNLALSFVSLNKSKRQAMNVFYAFCRVVDDISDDNHLPLWEKRKQLDFWRSEIDSIPSKQCQSPLGEELITITQQYHIEPELLHEIIMGVEMDLTKTRYADFNELSRYCYRVASAVGLVSIEIFGYKSPLIKDYAISLGMAFQLTNILRDVKADASRGRIYLPLDELSQWKITEENILRGEWNSNLRDYFRHFALRAEHYYHKAQRYLTQDEHQNMIAAELMRNIYWAILKKITRLDYNVLQHPVSLSKPEKLYYILKSLFWPFYTTPKFKPPKKVLIIGAGWAGQAAAIQLARLGHTVTLLEARKFIGGRAHSFQDPTLNEAVDNGQHILMGCYHETLKFLNHLAATPYLYSQNILDLHFISPKGPHRLKIPFNLAFIGQLIALAKYSALNWEDRFSILKLMTKIAIGINPDIHMNARQWLQHEKQTAQAIKALWEPLCLAAINLHIDTASALLLAQVIRQTLTTSPTAAKVILSTVGLTELTEHALKNYLHYCNGSLILGQAAQSLTIEDKRIYSVKYGKDQEWKGDVVISAIPWHSLKKLIPHDSDLYKITSLFSGSTILTWQLWFDGEIFPQPFVGLLDSPIHWIFNKNAFSQQPSKHGFPYTFVISGVESPEAWTSERLEQLALAECHKFFPQSRQRKILHRYFYKNQDATFLASPEIEPYRPGVRTEWHNLVLAGDWTDTGLPATIEGAVKSGHRAAAYVDEVI